LGVQHADASEAEAREEKAIVKGVRC
jgi:hypothetical protein